MDPLHPPRVRTSSAGAFETLSRARRARPLRWPEHVKHKVTRKPPDKAGLVRALRRGRLAPMDRVSANIRVSGAHFVWGEHISPVQIRDPGSAPGLQHRLPHQRRRRRQDSCNEARVSIFVRVSRGAGFRPATGDPSVLGVPSEGNTPDTQGLTSPCRRAPTWCAGCRRVPKACGGPACFAPGSPSCM